MYSSNYTFELFENSQILKAFITQYLQNYFRLQGPALISAVLSKYSMSVKWLLIISNNEDASYKFKNCKTKHNYLQKI